MFVILFSMKIIITTLFGLESPTKGDLLERGYDKDRISVSDGVVTLEGDFLDIARANMWIKHAERIFIEAGEFGCGASDDAGSNFDAFFEGTKAIKWSDYIPANWAFIVNGFSRKSKLYGIPALQKLAKKAIAESLAVSRGLSADTVISENEELGSVKIQFGIVNDTCRFMIDTTGAGLHKRGYRPLTHEAPIRETLASGMLTYAKYRPYGNEALVDPFCGSGTIVIEAARTACGIAPGRDRHYAYEDLPYIGKEPYRRALQEALDNEDTEPMDDCYFYGSDIDPKAIESAKRNADAAGVGKLVKFRLADAAKMTPEYLEKLTALPRQLVITNPPYGGRLMTPEDADKIYRLIGHNYLTRDGFCKKGLRLSVITPENAFEDATGYKPDKRVKLYNGAIVCTLSNYFRLGDKNHGYR
ncbi:MAG: class I SAM-dependent RNA methyltransferase [Clostridiales bacterium]|nr:class I SAM-dependent RNA methyltransferase [Clostridiales bacterium]